MTEEEFDAEVATIRGNGIQPRQRRRGVPKEYCTPREWAAYLEYMQVVRRRTPPTDAKKANELRCSLWRRYQITPEQHGAMLAGVGGVCSICGQPPRGGEKLHVDHHHGSGTVRGLACRHCNHGLGLFMDNSALLRKAADYLDAHGDPSFCFVTYAKLMEERHGNN